MTVRLICGDSAEELKAVPSGAVHLVVTSPPYGIGKSYEKKQAPVECVEAMRPIVAEVARVTAENGFIVWQVGYHVRNREVTPLDLLYGPLFEEFGFRLLRRIVWTFGHGLHAKYRFSGRHEMIMILARRDVATEEMVRRIELLDEQGDVWKITNVKANHPERTGAHPCQFPCELVRRAVAALTVPGELVLDPFFGSGTTGVVTEELGRECIGIEFDPGFVGLARDRIRSSLGRVDCGLVEERLAAPGTFFAEAAA